jgi:transcriptional regulator GlxA family with amidase domain
MLAETGLLDGCEVTSHWAAASLIRAHHPNILLAEQRVLSFAGQGQRLITAGGASSWQDLVLYLIMRFAGMDSARQVSKIFLFQWHRDGQSPFAALQRNAQHDDATIGQAQIWLADNYARDRALASAIEASGLQERTFNRRFRAATGYAPSEYLQSLRIEEAKQMLESSSTGIGDIANAVGYSDEASFRRLFRRLVGLSPAEYRRRYAFPELAAMA